MLDKFPAWRTGRYYNWSSVGTCKLQANWPKNWDVRVERVGKGEQRKQIETPE